MRINFILLIKDSKVQKDGGMMIMKFQLNLKINYQRNL